MAHHHDHTQALIYQCNEPTVKKISYIILAKNRIGPQLGAGGIHKRKKLAMLMQDDTLGREIAAKNKRQADVLWKILIAMRLVIPGYVLYAIYLYWTMPPSAYLLTGH